MLTVVNERVVVSTLCGAIMDQDSVKVVGDVVVIAERGLYLIGFLLNLLLDIALFSSNLGLVGGEDIRCRCKLSLIEGDTL